MTGKTASAGWGIAIGAAIGTAIGAALGYVGPWLAIGAGVGLLIPSHVGKHPAESAKRQAKK